MSNDLHNFDALTASPAGWAAPAPVAPRTQYEIEDLAGLGWVQITDMGDENLYFVLADGSLGFAKID